MKIYSNFPVLLQAFFTDRLMRQRQVSSETISSYRDAFCLLFKFTKQRLNKTPSKLEMEDLDASLIVAFLCWLEDKRNNCARTRNARLAAIHSFFKYASLYDPTHSGLIQRVLAIPGKRFDRVPVEYLTDSESEALLSAPDQTTWGGRRDKTLLLLTIQTGLRVSELVNLNCQDIVLGKGAHVHCIGKGRKERCTPLRKEIVKALNAWLHERNGRSSDPLFPNARGKRLSRDGVEYLLRKHTKTAAQHCPSLKKKRVSPHVLRHTAAMNLLQHGVDRSVIALWLGHETLTSVDVYVHANLQMKEKALSKTTPFGVPQGRYRPDDELLTFLKGL
ncbi:MAG: tyrosine-type recombinase/integrase [Aestuariibacter sp.]|nr:tyrosine-type recombinase/integrase [Aestuariibacter sp.]